ncbi:hypothetical protein AAGC94_06980 [Clostridium sporogenes]|uniref:hypothetical protein n=1 Tax=Clostridium sporogenes TaxID=1509 RepID=UPI00313C018C
MENLNIAINLNKGIEGVMEDINVLNFADGIFALHKFYGVSIKALSQHSGVNYNTMRVICALEENKLSERNTELAIKNLKAVYSAKK